MEDKNIIGYIEVLVWKENNNIIDESNDNEVVKY